MKKIRRYGLITLFVICYFIFTVYPVSADDICVLSKTVDDLLLDVVPEQDAVKVSGGDNLSTTGTFMAPVVPAAKTISRHKIYMAFFKPGEGNFWEGSVAKFGISADNQIVDANDSPATIANTVMKSDAVPYWATIDWADVTKSNYIHNVIQEIAYLD